MNPTATHQTPQANAVPNEAPGAAPHAHPPVEPFTWKDAWATGDARMDDTHGAFVQHLNAILTTPGRDQLPLYRQFVAHTVDHFAQEERWMVATGFAPDNCHAQHHATILDTLHAVEAHFLQGDNQIIQRLAEALAEWFPQHAATMDRGLALHLAAVGFDTRTETLADPSSVRPAHMSGCGSVTCS